MPRIFYRLRLVVLACIEIPEHHFQCQELVSRELVSRDGNYLNSNGAGVLSWVAFNPRKEK